MSLKPVAILQFSSEIPPGNFNSFLTNSGIPWQLIRIDQGESVPDNIEVFSGLGLLGGEMSVNDHLPWIAPVCDLIVQADQKNRPVIGHCLGGQLIAKAFGAQVRQHIRKELGWTILEVADLDLGLDWLGEGVHHIPAFQWHGDTFDLPPKARLLLKNQLCHNQAYVLKHAGGVAHLGMQCHMEMTPQCVRRWASDGHEEIAAAMAHDASGIQTAQDMCEYAEEQCRAMGVYTQRLYHQWAKGLFKENLHT